MNFLRCSRPWIIVFLSYIIVCNFQSLSGHTSPVEAVRFGNAEEMVVAGSMSGALKLWDLEQAKSKFTFNV